MKYNGNHIVEVGEAGENAYFKNLTSLQGS